MLQVSKTCESHIHIHETQRDSRILSLSIVLTPNHPLNPPTSLHPYLSSTVSALSPITRSLPQLPFSLTFQNSALPSSCPILHLRPFIQQKFIDHQWLLCARHFGIHFLSFCFLPHLPWPYRTSSGSSDKAFSLLLAITLVVLWLHYSSPSSVSSSTLFILQKVFLAPSPAPPSPVRCPFHVLPMVCYVPCMLPTAL